METETQQNNPTNLADRGDGRNYMGRYVPGVSGNPNGQPRHRAHMWAHFTKWMGMTPDELAKLDRTKLTASETAALLLVERMIAGRGAGSSKLARYCIDRDEGRSVQPVSLDNTDSLTDQECDEVRAMLAKVHGGRDADQPTD